MITLIATFNVQEGKMDEVISLLQAVVPVVRESEPGCLAYIPHTVKGAKNTIVMYEKYEDQAAFETHSANFPTYFKDISPLLKGKMDLKMCQEII
jgi:quinol monooxygenase YgiN